MDFLNFSIPFGKCKASLKQFTKNFKFQYFFSGYALKETIPQIALNIISHEYRLLSSISNPQTAHQNQLNDIEKFWVTLYLDCFFKVKDFFKITIWYLPLNNF